VTTPQIMWLPKSWGSVLQQPSRKNPVIGSVPHGSSATQDVALCRTPVVAVDGNPIPGVASFAAAVVADRCIRPNSRGHWSQTPSVEP
jgi:hypothetical protein